MKIEEMLHTFAGLLVIAWFLSVAFMWVNWELMGKIVFSESVIILLLYFVDTIRSEND